MRMCKWSKQSNPRRPMGITRFRWAAAAPSRRKRRCPCRGTFTRLACGPSASSSSFTSLRMPCCHQVPCVCCLRVVALVGDVFFWLLLHRLSLTLVVIVVVLVVVLSGRHAHHCAALCAWPVCGRYRHHQGQGHTGCDEALGLWRTGLLPWQHQVAQVTRLHWCRTGACSCLRVYQGFGTRSSSAPRPIE